MEVKITPTRKITVLGVDKRSLENLAWCATTYGINRLSSFNAYFVMRCILVQMLLDSFSHVFVELILGQYPSSFPTASEAFPSPPKHLS
jgi:hypothetical protein